MEDTLTHELVHAYDHCRYGQWLPFVGTQAPWAITCAAEVCSELGAALQYVILAAVAASAAAEAGVQAELRSCTRLQIDRFLYLAYTAQPRHYSRPPTFAQTHHHRRGPPTTTDAHHGPE